MKGRTIEGSKVESRPGCGELGGFKSMKGPITKV